MNEQLRPLTLGEILDRTLQIYRARFLVFFGIAALPAGIILVLAAGIFLFFAWFGSGTSSLNNRVFAGLLVLVFVGLLFLVALPALLAAVVLGTSALNAAAERAFHGEKLSIRASYTVAFKQFWRFLWLFLLQGLIAIGPPMALWMLVLPFVALAGALGASPVLPGLVMVVGGLGAVLYGIVAQMRVWLAFPACLVEDKSAWQAVQRANSLSKGTRARMFFLWLLGETLSRMLTFALAVPLLVGIELIPGADSPQHQEATGMAIFFIFFACFFAMQALVRPVYALALVVFYFDQRVRREAFDIEWMMQQAGMVPAPQPEPEAAPWLPPIAHRPAQPAALDEPHQVTPRETQEKEETP